MKFHRRFVDGWLQSLVVIGQRRQRERPAGCVRGIGRGAEGEQEARGEGCSCPKGLTAAGRPLGHHQRRRIALRRGVHGHGRRGHDEGSSGGRCGREDQEASAHAAQGLPEVLCVLLLYASTEVEVV